MEAGITRHGLQTGRCAALARIVHPVAQQSDPKACAIRMLPPKGATWLVPKTPRIPVWYAHVYVETRGHAVDAVTGSDGYSPSNTCVIYDQTEQIRGIDLDRGLVIVNRNTRLLCYVRPEHLQEITEVGIQAHVRGTLYKPLTGRPFVIVSHIAPVNTEPLTA